MPIINTNVIKILVLMAFSSGLAVFLTPILTHFLYRYKLWRKEVRTKSIDGKPVPIFNKFNKDKEVGTPRLGGLLIWVTTIFTAIFFAVLKDIPWIGKLNFLSRGETWLPLAILIMASLLGLFDDLFQIFSYGKYTDGGIKFTRRLAIVALIGVIGAWWFYFKLGWNTIHIIGLGDLEIGLWYIPLFVITIIACWSGGIIDGVDGLSGGSFSIIFSAFSIIAFARGQYDLAGLCAVLAGTTLAFLWFNIPPARFYMGETGIIGLTATLAVVAFLTDSVLVLPIIAGLLVIESGSAILQLLSKKFFKRKLFLAAPIHHHFEAKGWSPEKVTMRFWIIGIVLAIIGVAVRLLG